ncbi:hypothetical protein [Microbacterium sp. T32]|uniref:hypothetical protein n=1 Tax=Microbacterium sp. T32 TaxID=1776083 RepID=UPI0007ABAE44|nr:hypothetical protein [Microbacterium sp. T32]KZE41445.1 hypothetical protein AVW09_02315 [Microbacterium sp. T32]
MGIADSARWFRFVFWAGVGVLVLATASTVVLLADWAGSGEAPSLRHAIGPLLSVSTAILLMIGARLSLRRIARQRAASDGEGS